MRTKTILLTAALAAAGVASSMAQNVYSLNVVGYVNVSLAPGFQILANPLNIAAGNTLTSVLGTNLPDGTTVYKFSGGHYQNANAFAGHPDNVWFPDNTINPGEGFFILNPTGSPVQVTFTGEVLQGSLANPYVAGFSLIGSQVPQAGGLSSVLGFPAADGDTYYSFNSGTQHYNSALAYAGAPDNVWFPSEPSVSVAQGFFLSSSAGGSWARTFTVQ